MSRLIDADTLIKDINTWAMQCYAIESIFMLQTVVGKIEKQPTAYNEKVIEELEKLSLEAKTKAANLFCEADYLTNRTKQIAKQSNDMLAFAYDKAIEIVKRGGGNESNSTM